MKYALNIEPVFVEMDFCDRIGAAKKAGYDYIEFWDWYDKDIQKVKEACDKYDVKVSGFKGDKDYSLCGAEPDEFIEWMKKSIETAKFLQCDSIITHSNHFGENGSSDYTDRFSHNRHIANMVRTLTSLVPILEEKGITLYLEPLNNLGVDKGMFLVDVETASDVIRAVGSKQVKLLCDIYHMQMMSGNLTRSMLDNLDIMDYVHIADAPDRHETGTGELNYSFLLNTLKGKGFDGYFCFELWPKADMAAALKAMDELRESIR